MVQNKSANIYFAPLFLCQKLTLILFEPLRQFSLLNIQKNSFVFWGYILLIFNGVNCVFLHLKMFLCLIKKK